MVSPNPFTEYLNVNLDWNASEVVSVKILNVQGKEIVSKQVTLNKGSNYFKIDNLSNLPAGIYLLQFTSPTQRIVEKIVK
jgi:hypothetical protein